MDNSSIRLNDGTEKTIATIVDRSTAPIKFRLFLASLCEYLDIQYVIETGTCLGTTTSFLATNRPFPVVHTIEKEESLLLYIRKNMPQELQKNVIFHFGDVHEKLGDLANSIPAQLYFLDADHRYESIMKQISLALASPHTICIVIHDIYWSEGMKKAWEEIIIREEIRLTVDIYHAGVIFLKQNREKQHFHLAFW